MTSASKEFVAVLRVSGRRLDPRPLLAAYPRLRPDAVWRASDRGPLGRARGNGGFNLIVAAGSEGPATIRRAVARLQTLAPLLRRVTAAGATPELDVGVFADPLEWFVVNARFSPEETARVARLGVSLCVSSYPAARPEERAVTRADGAPRRTRPRARARRR